MAEFDIKEKLRKFLRGAKKVAILCIGNPLRGDDGVGIYIGEKLKECVSNATVFLGYNAPESVLFKIIDGDYSHVIIIDSGFIGEKAGDIRIADEARLPDDIITTHYFSPGLLVKLLKEYGKKVLIITIYPKRIDFNECLSDVVKNSADNLVRIIEEVLSEVK